MTAMAIDEMMWSALRKYSVFSCEEVFHYCAECACAKIQICTPIQEEKIWVSAYEAQAAAEYQISISIFARICYHFKV